MTEPPPDSAWPPPPLLVPQTPQEVVARLDERARRGKMAEFRAGPPPGLFSVTTAGQPFDYLLSAQGEASPEGTRLAFSLKVLPRTPLIFAAVLVFTIWPGVWLTDSMLRSYWTGYDYATWMWYLPVTVLPLPWACVRLWKRSRRAAESHALEIIADIRAALGA
ncbi:MAG: hypothetical protein SFY69_11715 [Planctomycetota bacterium]|nr:hypothetical protein [Planctomycetota bacterium]